MHKIIWIAVFAVAAFTVARLFTPALSERLYYAWPFTFGFGWLVWQAPVLLTAASGTWLTLALLLPIQPDPSECAAHD